METEITVETIMKMGMSTRSESMEFERDTFNNLLKKYKDIREGNEYIENSVRKTLDEQIELTIKHIASISSRLEMLKMMNEIIEEMK